MKIILIQFLVLMSTHLNAQNNSLTIIITGLKNNNGQIIMDIFNSGNGFPMKTENAIFRKKITIPKEGKVVFHIEGIKNGEYAFALIHDENNNDKLDLNFIGIPKEGVAASNNAKGFLSPPNYEDSSFIFYNSLEQTIKMLYF